MRVALLAHGALGAGATSVVKNLITALGRVAPENTYGVTIPKGMGYEEVCRDVPQVEVFPYHQGGRIGRWYWETFRLPALVRRFRPDVLLALADRGMVRPPCPQAVLLHRSQMFYPSRHFCHDTRMNRLLFRYHSHHLAKSLPYIDLLLCQTEAAAQRVRQRYGFAGRIEICPNAVSQFAAGGERAEMPDLLRPVAEKMRLFCLTRYYAHKNLESIVEMFDRYRKELADVAVILTISPEQHPKAAWLLAKIDRMRLTGQIVNIGPVVQSQLGDYYRHCSGLLLPTLLESFSGTYLEAMHFGRPILTSDLDFAHVVCGDAAVYFDPWNPSAMKDAIVRLKGDPALADDLVEKGRVRLSTMFRSWDDIAGDLAGWLGQCARGGRSDG